MNWTIRINIPDLAVKYFLKLANIQLRSLNRSTFFISWGFFLRKGIFIGNNIALAVIANALLKCPKAGFHSGVSISTEHTRKVAPFAWKCLLYTKSSNCQHFTLHLSLCACEIQPLQTSALRDKVTNTI